MSDQRIINLALAEEPPPAPGAGSFVFLEVSTPYLTYAAGAPVVLNIEIQNNGALDVFTCEVFDNDTGELLNSFSYYLNSMLFDLWTVAVGAMPPRDWNLRVYVHP